MPHVAGKRSQLLYGAGSCGIQESAVADLSLGQYRADAEPAQSHAAMWLEEHITGSSHLRVKHRYQARAGTDAGGYAGGCVPLQLAEMRLI